jgi:pimeloyl-ACP methyl ester carboxylesterase
MVRRQSPPACWLCQLTSNLWGSSGSGTEPQLLEAVRACLRRPARVKARDWQGLAALFGAGDFALVAPDYLGLGLSPGPHPYLHRATEASASLDLLTAARRAAQELNVNLPQSVYLTGFSQGGQAALALDEAIETQSDSPWRVAAVAPVGGPYDLSDTEFPGLIDGSGPTNSAYLVYLAVSYVQILWYRECV